MYNLAKLQSSEIMSITNEATSRVNNWTQLKLDNSRLSGLTESSQVVGEFLAYLEYNKKNKSFLDNLPYIGTALRQNRYSNMTIEDAVEKFASHINDVNKVVDNMIVWLQRCQDGADNDLLFVNSELKNVQTTITDNEQDDTSRINYLKYKKTTGGIIHEESKELIRLLQNLEIIKGSSNELETNRNSLEAKYILFGTLINNAIKIQGEAKKARALPNVLRVALEAISATDTLKRASGSLKDGESIVKVLLGEAVNSTNELTEETNKIQASALEFKSCISGLKECKAELDNLVVSFK